MPIIKNLFLDPTFIKDGTPANAMVRFLFAWKSRKPDLMLEVCQVTWKSKPKAKEKLELWFGDIFLVGAKIMKMRMLDNTSYDAIVQVGLRRRGYNKVVAGIITARIDCEDVAFSRSINGKWGINPLSILKAIGVYRKIFVDQENELRIN